MGLEEIEGIRADLKELTEQRELNISDAIKTISNIQEKYKALLNKEGEKYCSENCPDIPVKINGLLREFRQYRI